MPANESGLALVLSGGGARGAYPAGVLRGLYQLGVRPEAGSPFEVLVGTSAGSINAAMMAAMHDRPAEGVAELCRVWADLRPSQVFRTDPGALAGNVLRWFADLALGGLLDRRTARSLLDNTPTRDLLARIPLWRIAGHLHGGRLRALAIGTICYTTSEHVLFLQAVPDAPVWTGVHSRVARAPIRAEHLMASSAIPLFFPTVCIDGLHFGDGCVRNTRPLAPAIRLGARRVVAVGIREPYQGLPDPRPGDGPPSTAVVVSTLLDAVMLDAIETDVAHCRRLNEQLDGLDDRPQPAERKLEPVDVLWLGPSRSLAVIAHEMRDRIPRPLRYLLRGLGSDREAAELASYLLFDSVYCMELIRLGQTDVLAQEERVREFFGRRP